MASKSTTITAPGGGAFTFKIEFTETSLNSLSESERQTAISNNTLPISVKTTLTSTGGAFSGSANQKLEIYWFDDSKNASGKLLNTLNMTSFTSKATKTLSGSISPTHKDDGTLKGYAKAVFTKSGTNQYVPPTSSVQTASTTLTTLPRSSTITKQDGVAVDSTTDLPVQYGYTLNASSTSFTHTLKYEFTNPTNNQKQSGTLATGITGDFSICFAQSQVHESYDYLFPFTYQQLGQMIPNAPSLAIDLILETYNGETLIGTSILKDRYEAGIGYTATTKLEATDDLTKRLTGATNVFINGISKVKATINATMTDYSSIIGYQFTNRTLYESNTNTYTFQNVVDSSFPTYGFEFINSRGKVANLGTKSLLTDYSLLNYTTPKISSFIAKRKESTSTQADLIVNGSFWNKTFGSTNNTISLKYRYYTGSNKEYSAYTNVTPVKDGDSFNFNGILSGIPVNTTATVEMLVTDSTGASYSLTSVVTRGIHIREVGYDSDKEEYYINYNGDLCVNDYSVSAYSDTDLDDFIQMRDNKGNAVFPILPYSHNYIEAGITANVSVSSTSASKITLNKEISKTGEGLTLSGGNVVIGEGINRVKVSAKMYTTQNPTSSGGRMFRCVVYKNGTATDLFDYRNFYAVSGTYYNTLTTGEMEFDVEEGDTFSLYTWNNMASTINANKTSLIVEAVESTPTSTGGGGGTSDYEELTRKPSINGETLIGNKTSDDLGLASKQYVDDLVGDLENILKGI